MNPETGKRERESSDARGGDDGKGTPGAVKRAWSRPRVRLVVLGHTLSGTVKEPNTVLENGHYIPNTS